MARKWETLTVKEQKRAIDLLHAARHALIDRETSNRYNLRQEALDKDKELLEAAIRYVDDSIRR